MSGSARQKVMERYYAEMWNRGDLDVIDELLTDDYVNIDPVSPGNGRVHGRAGMKALIGGYRTAFPDFVETPVEQFFTDEVAVTRWRASGTWLGPLHGQEPTGKHGATTGITISRFAGDRIREDIVNWDALGFFRQVGLLPGQE